MNNEMIFANRIQFRNWLETNCFSQEGIWLRFDKATPSTTLKASEALEEALCFGWIDGQMKRVDEQHYIKYFALRRKNSKLSEKNKALVQKLEEKVLMCDAGRAKIQEAKDNGQWVIDQTIHVDDEGMQALLHELEGIEPAFSNYQAMSPSVKKTYVKAFQDPKTAEGKQKRLQWIIDRLQKNLKPM